MKTTVRFESAVSKLYKAYHAGELNAMDCRACAVGNICNNSNKWADLMYGFKNPTSEIDKSIYPNILVTNETIKRSGYSIYELGKIESIFLKQNEKEGCIKERQFKGLCAVIEYLCELDNIPNIMDFKALFETEADKPKYELSKAFVL